MQPEPTLVADEPSVAVSAATEPADAELTDTEPTDTTESTEAADVATEAADGTTEAPPSPPQRKIRILQRELRRLRVDNLRLRADLEEVRAQACDWLPARPSDSARLEIEAAADRVADRIESVSPETAQNIRDEVGSNLRRRLESVALVAEKELTDARRRAAAIRKRAQTAATTITETAESNASFHTELSRLAAEEAAGAIRREAEAERETALSAALALKERAELAAIGEREQAIRAAERIIGEAHNRAHTIIREARIRAEDLLQTPPPPSPPRPAPVEADAEPSDELDDGPPTLQLPAVVIDPSEETNAAPLDITDDTIASAAGDAPQKVESATDEDEATPRATGTRSDAAESAIAETRPVTGRTVAADSAIETLPNKSFESLWNAEVGYDEEDLRKFFDNADRLPENAADALFS